MKKLFYLFLLSILSLELSAQITTKIPFDLTAGLMKVPVEINGHTYFFIFDTGAEGCAVRSDLIDEINATWLKTDTAYDSHDNVSIQSLYEVKTLGLGTAIFNNVKMISYPNSPVFACLGIDGLIGVNIIEQKNWLFDFSNRYIGIIDKDFDLKKEGFSSIPFSIEGLRPKIHLNIGGKTIDFLFDSGATVNDIDSITYVAIKDSIIKSYQQIRESYGLLTNEYRTVGTKVFINTSSNSNYPSEFNTIDIGENKIGNRFWNGNQVYLSWKKQQLAMKITNNSANKYFGITFKIKDSSIVVSSLSNSEQMKTNKINVGDKILSINNIEFTDNCELKKYIDKFGENMLTIVMIDKRKIQIRKE